VMVFTTGFTGTKVQILTQEALADAQHQRLLWWGLRPLSQGAQKPVPGTLGASTTAYTRGWRLHTLVD
jgi:hypothetical protein